ncbi:hypothetical protein C8J56DRAFT_1161979 [Mycena floridula]|nr:hypothetical protein C8J56DRAFT_1161979 [Mycena floridula]
MPSSKRFIPLSFHPTQALYLQMSPKIKFFMTGVTGYIGGPVLERFLSHPNAPNFEITVLVRSQTKADQFRSFGVNPIVGSLSDLELVEKLAAEADVVVAMADCDDVNGATATLRGLKKRYQATGKLPIFINTSGTGVLADDAHGLAQTTELIYDDTNADQIETLAPEQPHRPVDLLIVAADQEGYVKTYIIAPSTIFGIGNGKLANAGLASPQSIQIPSIIQAGLARGQGGVIGEGKNIWNHVHIDEIADLYLVLYDSIVNNPATGHGRNGFYFGANDEYQFYETCKRISEVLVQLGRGKSPTPTPFTEDEMNKYLKGAEIAYKSLASNSRCVANRSYSIGWNPKKKTADFLQSIQPEVEALIAQGF